MSQDSEWFRRRRETGRIGVLGVSRLLAFQAIQVSLFVVLVQGVWVAVLGGVVGAAAIVVAFGRWNGRWITDTALLWWRLRGRRGVVGDRPDDDRLAALGELVPDLVVEDIPGPDGSRLGMGSDGAGWFAVLEVQPAGEPTSAGIDPPVPLAALVRIAAEAGLAGVVVQVVSYSGQSVLEAPDEPANRQQLLWVAVRLDAEAVARSAIDPAGSFAHQVDVPAVLAELTRRVRRALKRTGLGTRVLDTEGLIDALVLSCDLAGNYRPGLIREEWQAWHSPRMTHRCFWLRTWPAPDRGTALLGKLRELPGARVSVALVLTPHNEDGEADLRCLIRLATLPHHAGQVAELATRLAEQEGGRLFALDGEQAPAVYASAPSGGGAR